MFRPWPAETCSQISPNCNYCILFDVCCVLTVHDILYWSDNTQRGGVSLSLSLSKKKRVELPGKLLIFKSYMAFNCNKFRFTKYRVSGQIRMKVHETHINAMPSRYLQYSVMTLWWTHGEVGVGWLQWKHRNAATVAADGIHGNPRQPANHTDMRGIAITMVTWWREILSFVTHVHFRMRIDKPRYKL